LPPAADSDSGVSFVGHCHRPQREDNSTQGGSLTEMTTLPRRSIMLAVLVVIWCSPAAAEEWSRAYISRLPDSAFAVVETAPDGRKVRHLPHHDETGAVDLAHLRAARSRLGQVRWLRSEEHTSELQS